MVIFTNSNYFKYYRQKIRGDKYFGSVRVLLSWMFKVNMANPFSSALLGRTTTCIFRRLSVVYRSTGSVSSLLWRRSAVQRADIIELISFETVALTSLIVWPKTKDVAQIVPSMGIFERSYWSTNQFPEGWTSFSVIFVLIHGLIQGLEQF